MANHIYRYPLTIAEINEIELPDGASTIACQIQYNRPTIWAIADPDRPMMMRKFRGYGTGEKLDAVPQQYITTLLLDEGAFVWHIFELL